MKTKISRVDAHWIGNSFSIDPDLMLPVRPRLLPELLVVPFGGDGLLFLGSEIAQVIRGKSAKVLLPRVFPLLDGRTTIEELAAQMPEYPSHAARDVVSLLYSRGLLEDGTSMAPASRELAALSSFLGRHIDVSRANGNRDEALLRLKHARTVLSGDVDLVRSFARHLESSSIPLLAATEPIEDSLFHLSVTCGEVFSGLDDLQRAFVAGKSCLVVRLGARGAHLGPFLKAGSTICPSCLVRHHAGPIGLPDPTWAEYWIGLASSLSVLWLSRVTAGLSIPTYRVFSLDSDGELGEEVRLVPRMPGCDDCGLPGSSLELTHPAMLPWAYHCSTAFQSREHLSPKDHQHHYLVANLELASEQRRPLFGASRFPLPAPCSVALQQHPDWAELRAPAGSDGLSLQVLSTFLGHVAGECVENGACRRLTPTGGNLGSVELWVAIGSLECIPAGVYRYYAPGHALERVHEASIPSISNVLRSCLSTLDDRFVLFATGDLAKCSQKYNAFAYRLTGLDSGVTLAFGHRVAESLGLHMAELRDFDDEQLARMLGVAFKREYPVPTFAAVLSFDVDAIGSVLGSRFPVAEAPVRETTEKDLTYEAMDCIRQAAVVLHARNAPSIARGFVHGSTARVRHPRSLGQAIYARRSVRSYGAESIGRNIVEALLFNSSRFLFAREALGAEGASLIRPLLAVARPQLDLPVGIYEISDCGTALKRRADFSTAAMAGCINQASLGSSPMAIFAVGNLRRALFERGARGYRELAQDAGAAIGHILLEASAFGLVGCAAGGVIADGLRVAAGLNGFDECPLLAFHFGAAPDSNIR